MTMQYWMLRDRPLPIFDEQLCFVICRNVFIVFLILKLYFYRTVYINNPNYHQLCPQLVDHQCFWSHFRITVFIISYQLHWDCPKCFFWGGMGLSKICWAITLVLPGNWGTGGHKDRYFWQYFTIIPQTNIRYKNILFIFFHE